MTYEAAKVWICGVTICLEGVHFCHPKTKMCSKCADFSRMCFTEHHQPNCTTWCQGKLLFPFMIHINPFKRNRLPHHFQLDKPSFQFKGFSVFIQFISNLKVEG